MRPISGLQSHTCSRLLMKHPASITSLINCSARAYMKNGNMSEAKALRLLGNALNWIAFLPWLLVMRGINELNHDSSDFGAWLEIALGVALSILLGSAGAKHIKKAKKLSAPSADDLVVRDPRPPVIYLRSFLDDPIASKEEPQETGAPGGGTIAGPTEEQQLAGIMNQIGPFIAIGDPSERFPELGAARTYVLGTEWKDRVLAWILGAKLVVLRAGTTEGFWWEVETVAKNVKPEQIIFLIPLTATEYQAFRKRAETLLPCRLPDYPRRKRLIGTIRGIIFFHSDWTPHFLQLRGTIWLGWTPALKLTFEPVFKQLGVDWKKPWEFYARIVFMVFFSLLFAFFIAVLVDALLEHKLRLAR
jgi:hypothetical protein